MAFRREALRCLGRFPERTSPEMTTVQTWDKGTHTLRLVSYFAQKGERVGAYLLLPKAERAKLPAVLALHQHANEYHLGKSEPAGLSGDPLYHYGLDLCLRGYAVLCPDHLCFEDRRPPQAERTANPHLEGSGFERLMFCKYLLEGSSLQAKYLSDLVSALDALCSLPEVDSGRIGAIGHSLGGQEALWLAWYDRRIRAAVSSCGFSQIRSILREGINHNFAMFTPGFLNAGDVADLVGGIAPRAFLMTNGKADPLFPLDGAEEIAGTARRLYDQEGKAEHFRHLVFEGGHSLPPEVKEAAFAWLDRFLQPS